MRISDWSSDVCSSDLIYSKMQVYDGESLKDTDPKAKSYQEYRDYAGVDEGMNGLSTRFAFKILSRVFNFDNSEVAANPVHLLRSEESSVGKECVSKCRARWSPYN